MIQKRIIIFVEGRDDRIFINNIIKPKLKEKYSNIEILEHAKRSPKLLNKQIKSLNAILDYDYIYLADLDFFESISKKKVNSTNKISSLRSDKIFISVKTIEAWYLAGLSDRIRNKYKLKIIPFSDDINKQKFENLFTKKYLEKKVILLNDLTIGYSIEVAINKNKSFSYFITNFLLKNTKLKE